MRVGHPPVFKRQVIGVHAPVPQGGNGATAQHAALGLLEAEGVVLGGGFFHQQQAQALVAQRAVRVGPRHHHQHAGLAGKGAPGLGTVQTPSALDTIGAQGEAGHIRTVVRLGHGDGTQGLALREAGQPMRLLRLGAAGQQGAAQNFRARDQAARRPQRGLRQGLGHGHHDQVVVLTARTAATIGLGDGQSEHAHLAQRLQQGFGDGQVFAVDVLGHGRHHLLPEALEGLLHQADGRIEVHLTQIRLGGLQALAGSGQRSLAARCTPQIGPGGAGLQALQRGVVQRQLQAQHVQTGQNRRDDLHREHPCQFGVQAVGRGRHVRQGCLGSQQFGAGPGHVIQEQLMLVQAFGVKPAGGLASPCQRFNALLVGLLTLPHQVLCQLNEMGRSGHA